jgi:hypothetical protein
MAVEGTNYEVDWQLPPSCDRAAPSFRASPPLEPVGPSEPDARRASRTSWEWTELARFARLLAEVDAAAVVIWHEQELIVERAVGAAATLVPGTRLAVHPSAGGIDRGALESLLSGRLRWCRTVPPVGFSYASLVFAPTLASSGRLLLVANRESPLTHLNLRLVAAYLAQMSRLASWKEPQTSRRACPVPQNGKVLYL